MEGGSNIDGYESGELPHPGRVPTQDFWSPEACWQWRRRSEFLLEKRVLSLEECRHGEYIGEGGSQGGHHVPRRPPGTATPYGAPPGRLGPWWWPSGPT